MVSLSTRLGFIFDHIMSLIDLFGYRVAVEGGLLWPHRE